MSGELRYQVACSVSSHVDVVPTSYAPWSFPFSSACIEIRPVYYVPLFLCASYASVAKPPAGVPHFGSGLARSAYLRVAVISFYHFCSMYTHLFVFPL